MQIRVYYEDTDAGGIVYHSNYLNFCERARSEYFFQKGMTPVVNDAHFVVRKMDCDFIASAKFADVIEVTTNVLELKRASFKLFHEIKKDEKVLFTATVVVVLAKEGKVQRIDQEVKKLLESLFM